MLCDEVDNLLNALQDGELPSEDAARLEAHLAQCPRCAQLQKTLMAQDRALADAFAARRNAAIDVASRVIAQLPQPIARRRIPWMTMVASAAAGFGLALAIFYPRTKLVYVSSTQPTTAPVIAAPTSQPLPVARLDELLCLGDQCVVPLTNYIASSRSHREPAARVAAARIVADVAPPSAIPKLIELLHDNDGDVRCAAASGLLRLTGQDLDRPPERWRLDDRFTCEATTARWRTWWQHNKNRFPGAVDLMPEENSSVAKEPVPLKKG